jgi:hypothetical protein
MISVLELNPSPFSVTACPSIETLVVGRFGINFKPTTKIRHPEVRKRASVFGSPFAPGFGVNGQSLQVGPKDLVLEGSDKAALLNPN